MAVTFIVWSPRSLNPYFYCRLLRFQCSDGMFLVSSNYLLHIFFFFSFCSTFAERLSKSRSFAFTAIVAAMSNAYIIILVTSYPFFPLSANIKRHWTPHLTYCLRNTWMTPRDDLTFNKEKKIILMDLRRNSDLIFNVEELFQNFEEFSIQQINIPYQFSVNL